MGNRVARTQDTISITRKYDGSYECSTIHGGYLVHMRYFGYSRKDALNMFRDYLETGVSKSEQKVGA